MTPLSIPFNDILVAITDGSLARFQVRERHFMTRFESLEEYDVMPDPYVSAVIRQIEKRCGKPEATL